MTAGPMRDTARRKTTEQESGALFQAVWESATDALAVSDPEGIVLMANPAYYELYGYGPEEVLGRSFAIIFPPDQREMAIRQYREAFDADVPTSTAEATIRRADGAERVVEARYHFLEEDGRRTAMVSLVRDITERLALERLQRDFLAMVTHELRTPLTAVKGYAQLLEKRGVYSAEAVRTIRDQATLLERLVGDIMQASELEAGRLSLQLESVDLVREVRAGVERFRAQTEDHTLRVEAPDELPEGRWDRDRIGQVLSNLLSNAIKYSPDGGEILVRVEDGGTEARVSVTDHGLGVPPEALPRLFDRFYRVDSASGSARGQGLGLYISRGIIEAHGGRIAVQSQPGIGSTFSFSLPYGR